MMSIAAAPSVSFADTSPASGGGKEACRLSGASQTEGGDYAESRSR